MLKSTEKLKGEKTFLFPFSTLGDCHAVIWDINTKIWAIKKNSSGDNHVKSEWRPITLKFKAL